MKAIWNNQVVADSNNTLMLEGNYYFPSDSVKKKFFKRSEGRASYYTLEINGKINEDAAWYYPEPKEAAKKIKDHVAFWKGVKVER